MKLRKWRYRLTLVDFLSNPFDPTVNLAFWLRRQNVVFFVWKILIKPPTAAVEAVRPKLQSSRCNREEKKKHWSYEVIVQSFAIV